MPTVWLNGSLLDADDASVPVSDHGLTVGDVFERAGLRWRVTAHHPDGRFNAEML